jgi:hypothetical protein
MGNVPDQAEGECALPGATVQMWTRASEASLVAPLVDAVAQQRAPTSDREADVYRFSSQLLKSRYQHAAAFLDSAARQFYATANVLPRSFAQVLADGLVDDTARLRHLLELRMEGQRGW